MKWLDNTGCSIDSLVTPVAGLQSDLVPLITILQVRQLSLFSLLGLKEPVQDVNILVWLGENQESFHGAELHARTKSPGAAEFFQYGAVPQGTEQGVLQNRAACGLSYVGSTEPGHDTVLQ